MMNKPKVQRKPKSSERRSSDVEEDKENFLLDPSILIPTKFVLDETFEFDAPKYYDFKRETDSNLAVADELENDFWFEKKHWSHENPEANSLSWKKGAALQPTRSTNLSNLPAHFRIAPPQRIALAPRDLPNPQNQNSPNMPASSVSCPTSFDRSDLLYNNSQILKEMATLNVDDVSPSQKTSLSPSMSKPSITTSPLQDMQSQFVSKSTRSKTSSRPHLNLGMPQRTDESDGIDPKIKAEIDQLNRREAHGTTHVPIQTTFKHRDLPIKKVGRVLTTKKETSTKDMEDEVAALLAAHNRKIFESRS
eukprot:TRINITY_DN12734_c0_g1_i1.p1 TRINITY_DN12734_c0_g1~~TRINITY_DN12734_c0_g1_i1.p1  ORF type:complete len:307 (-),score=70.84 TRINITY_DN12734_c0_g1_i1:45-965(-)